VLLAQLHEARGGQGNQFRDSQFQRVRRGVGDGANSMAQLLLLGSTVMRPASSANTALPRPTPCDRLSA